MVIFIFITTRYRITVMLISIALAFGSLMACAKAAPRMVPTIRETASQWNAAVDKHLPDAQRAGKVKQLGLQLIELQDSLSSDIAVLNDKAIELNANYDATKDETRHLLAVFFEKRNAALAQYRDLVFAVRREVSKEEWRALTR